jgi:uncharacterized protein YhfF
MKMKQKKKTKAPDKRGSSDGMDLSNNSDQFILNGGKTGLSSSALEDEELLMSR